MEILKNSTFNFICNRLYRIDSNRIDAGGKSAGLGTIAGMADSYWGQNKGRSMEGAVAP